MGAFAKILNEEIGKAFLPIDTVAKKMDVHISTARRWLSDFDAKFILHEGIKLFQKDDVSRIIERRKQSKIKKSEQ